MLQWIAAFVLTALVVEQIVVRLLRRLRKKTSPPEEATGAPQAPAPTPQLAPAPPSAAPPAAPLLSAPRKAAARPRGLPEALPLSKVAFDFIVIARSGEPIGDGEFHRRLLSGPSARNLSAEARRLLLKDAVSLQCVQRIFVQGRVKREPEEFALCRRLANRAQTTVSVSDRDVIAMGRGAFRLRYAGPVLADGGHLGLMVHAAETVRAIRPGLVVDAAAMLVWGEHAWETQLKRNGGLSPKEHFKMELSMGRPGLAISTRGLLKFGLPELRVEGLPQDIAGVAATCLSSIALDLIHAPGPLDPTESFPVPSVRGAIGFHYERPAPQYDYPLGFFRLLGGVDREKPTLLGLLEVLTRLRQSFEDGGEFWQVDQVDLGELQRQAQQALPRLKAKFQAREPRIGRVFLVRWLPQMDGESNPEIWISLQEWEGSTLRGAVAVGPAGGPAKLGRAAALDESEVLDWMILRGGDVEDGGFGLRMAGSNQTL